jgi:ABC-type sugar transport system permease subunit
MTIDWPSFAFGAASAIAAIALIITTIIIAIVIRSSRYKAHPLFNKDNS